MQIQRSPGQTKGLSKPAAISLFLCALVILGVTGTPGFPFLHAPLLLCILGVLFLVTIAWRRLSTRENSTGPDTAFPTYLYCFAGLLTLYVCSSAIFDSWFFPTHWKGDHPFFEDPLGSGVIRSLISACVVSLLFERLLMTKRFLLFTWLAFAALAMNNLYEATGFEMIYRVDSPSFVYRFWCFEQTFPKPGFYDPNWNAGMPVPYLVASGIWSMGVLLLPFLAWIPAQDLYTPMLAFFFIGLVPGLAWCSMRWIGAGTRAGWIAALLALGSCQRFWVHLLHYGTSPSLLAMSMVLPLAALWYRFLYLDQRPRAGTLAGLLLCALVMFAWPGSITVAIPFLVVTLLHGRQLFPHRWVWTIVGLLLIFIIMLPLALVPMRYSNLAAFTQTTVHQSILEHFKDGLGVMAHNMRGTNPLIVILGFAGSFFLFPVSMRYFFGPLLLMMLVMSGWGEEFKALLQSERLIIPAALIGIIPASLWLDRFIAVALASNPRRNIGHAASRALVAWMVGILFIGAYQGAKTWNGKGLAPFHAYPDRVQKLVDWIASEVPEDGRVMFAGRAVHAYGGAKIAALPMLTGREMMSCDFYGFSPKLVEFQYPPRAFRYDGPDALCEFNELHNITHILTWHDDWKQVYGKEPDRYRLAYEDGRIAGFEVLRDSDMFLVGEGKVHADFDRFDLELPGDGKPVVIKYNWAEGLRTSQDVKLYPHDAGRGVTFIGIDPGTNRNATIGYRR